MTHQGLRYIVEKAGFERPTSRWLYEMRPLLFELTNDPAEQDEIMERGPTKLTREEVVDILTKPFDAYDAFSIGAGMLPMTRRVIN